MSRALFPKAFLASAALLLTPFASEAESIFRFGEKWEWASKILGSSSSAADTADKQLLLAESFEKKGDWKSAQETYKRIAKKFPFAEQTATARFRLARALEQRGKYDEAFDAYDAYLSKHPDGRDFDNAMESMFGIAKRFMNGERRRLWGIKTFASNQRAEEMFNTILKRAPYSKSAGQVLFFRGMMMERQGKDAEALVTYQQIIERFPSDPVADEAQYQMGFVRMRSVRSGSNDKTDRVRAQEAFEDFVSRAPTSEKQLQARENLRTLSQKDLQDLLDIAKFYDKTKKVKSAVLYYRDVIREAEGSAQANFAKKRLEELKKEFGPDAVRLANEPAENAENAQSKRRMQASINTVSRPDYVGPQVDAAPLEKAPKGPSLRISPSDLNALPEPALPLTDPILNPGEPSKATKQ